jgi:hypothetical protein
MCFTSLYKPAGRVLGQFLAIFSEEEEDAYTCSEEEDTYAFAICSQELFCKEKFVVHNTGL